MTEKQQIVIEAIQRFPQLPSRTIARYILFNHGDLFDNNLEKIRCSVRSRLGTHGDKNRQNVTNIIPRLAPVVMPQTWRKPREPFILNPGLWLCLFDVHIPFHEPKALEAALAYGKKHKVTGIILGGDAQDCAAISFWQSSRKRDFDKEVELFIDFLDLLDQEFPKAEKVYKPGNHEYRLPRYYQIKAPELIGLPLAAMDTILGLEHRGIEFLDYKQIIMAGKLPILHGDELPMIARSVNPARGLFLRTKSWSMCGHCHTTSQHNAKNIQGVQLTTWSVGCLCDLQPDYNVYGNDWNWGFAIVNVEKDGSFEVDNRRILPSGKVA
jgi:hypothetical protein